MSHELQIFSPFVFLFCFWCIFPPCEFFLNICISFLGLLKWSQIGWLEKTKFILLHFGTVEGEVQNQVISRTMLPPKVLEKNPSLALPDSGGYQQPLGFLAWGSVTPVSAFVFTWPSSLTVCVSEYFSPSKDTSHWVRAHPGLV